MIFHLHSSVNLYTSSSVLYLWFSWSFESLIGSCDLVFAPADNETFHLFQDTVIRLSPSLVHSEPNDGAEAGIKQLILSVDSPVESSSPVIDGDILSSNSFPYLLLRARVGSYHSLYGLRIVTLLEAVLPTRFQLQVPTDRGQIEKGSSNILLLRSDFIDGMLFPWNGGVGCIVYICFYCIFNDLVSRSTEPYKNIRHSSTEWQMIV